MGPPGIPALTSAGLHIPVWKAVLIVMALKNDFETEERDWG